MTVRHSPELARDEMVNGVRVIRLRPVSRFSRGQITPALLWAAPQLIRDADIVQIHTPLPEGPLIGTWCRLLGRPLLMTHHGDLVMPPGVFNQFLERTGYLILRATGLLANAVTSYSRDYAEHSPLLRHFQGKLNCILPPIEIPSPDGAAVLAWRSALGLDDKLTIGFAGRWVEEKGFDYLLQALPRIHSAYPNAHLVFAGDTNVVYDRFYSKCLPYLEPVQEYVTNVGLIRDPQRMANFYALCDLFVQPSRTDMLGLTQVEAMLCGTPVVTSDVPGARVALQKTGFGLLAEPRNPMALAEAICDVLANRDHYKPVPECVRQVFDQGKSLTQYQILIQDLLCREERHPAASLEFDERTYTTFGRTDSYYALSRRPVAVEDADEPRPCAA